MTLTSQGSVTARPAWMCAALLFVTLGAAACGGDDGAPELVDDDGDTETVTTGTTVPTTTAPLTTGNDGADSSSGFNPICSPGERRCNEAGDSIEECAATGLEFEVLQACGQYSTCQPCTDDTCVTPSCVGPCELTENDPSSAGCAFVANRQLHIYEDFADGLVITNPNEELTARVDVFEVPEGLLDEVQLDINPDDEDDMGVFLDPGQSITVELTTEFIPGTSSNIRTGGIFRAYSDIPVIAYQHAPLRGNRGNESALLLPDRVLGNDYVVMSYTSLSASNQLGASYFELVALEDDTRVQWTPPVKTAGNGLPIDPVEAGATGELILNRYETIRIVPSREDLDKKNFFDEFEMLDISGTIIKSDKPVWVTGANKFSRVPSGIDGGTGDQLQETLFPLQHWGRSYVLPTALQRTPEEGDPNALPEQYEFYEANYYRFYAGAAGLTITSDPPNPAFPVMLENVGDFVDVETEPGTSLTVAGNGPFMPMQYLRSKDTGDEIGEPRLGFGDSAMVQMVPTEQYLSRYAFSTGVNFFYHFLQITRAASDDVVTITSSDESGAQFFACKNPGDAIDCAAIFEQVGDFEVAWMPIPEGTYVAESDTEFGIIQTGHGRGTRLDEDGNPIDEVCVNLPDSGECNATYAYPGGMKAEAIFIP